MSGEKGNFKSRVFGGFNRHDVIGYIEKLAAERNALAMDNENLRGRLEALEERLENAAPETPAEPDTGEMTAALDRARETLDGLKAEYDAICGDVRINVTQTDHELKVMSDKLSQLTAALRSAGERLDEIRAGLDRQGE